MDAVIDMLEVCPACGNEIGYCPGHPVTTDPLGWAALNNHERGGHDMCNITAPCYTPVVEPPHPTHRRMYPYAYNTGDRSHRRWYENDQRQHDLTRATVWCVHLSVEPRDKVAALSRVAAHHAVTGEYTYADSWETWGENHGEGTHLVIYFRALSQYAWITGRDLARLADGEEEMFAVTTSGDYAMQIGEPS